MVKIALAIVVSLLIMNPVWTSQTSGVTARLRGVSAVNEQVAWASGANSTVLRTTDGGSTWQKLNVTTDTLDFRDIDAVDAQTAYALSIGTGPASRIYKTSDSGSTWTLQFKNENPKAFLDAMSFWDAQHGIVFGDSIDGRLDIMTTENGGQTWTRLDPGKLPSALPNEGAFAASGTNIAVFGKDHAWIGTGGATRARILRTVDRGRTWRVFNTPLQSAQSSGIFSIAFRDKNHGVIVGGDYAKENEAVNNMAFTTDGGETWELARGLSGFRSVVAYVPGKKDTLVAMGPTGGDYSTDDGRMWKPIPGTAYDTFSFVKGKAIGWASGAKGNIGKLLIE
jgi:photosystem II stability/assembly factor-like uncharacterized protein